MSTAGLRNVSCPTFDGHEYPRWKAMMKKRLMAMDSELWTVTEIGLTDLCKMAEADDIRKYTLLNLTAKDVICSCLSRNQFRNVMHLNHAKLISDRLSEVYESHLNRHDPWLDDYKESLKEMTFPPKSTKKKDDEEFERFAEMLRSVFLRTRLTDILKMATKAKYMKDIISNT